MSLEKAFIAIGFREAEAAVISFMFEHERCTVDEIIQGTKLSRGTVYKALNSLANQSYVTKTDTKPVNYLITLRVTVDLKNQMEDFYRKINAKIKPIRIVETHLVLKRISTIFEKSGYGIKDIPKGERVTGIRFRTELLDKIAEGEYSLGILILDKKKKLEVYPRGLITPFLHSDLHRISRMLNCITIVVFIHTDRKDCQRLYEDLTQTRLRARVRAGPFEPSENYGMQNKEVIVFKTDDNLEDRITGLLQEIHQRRIITSNMSRSLKEKINQIQELILLGQEHARKIDSLLLTKAPFEKSMVGKAFDEISDPVQRIKNREVRNIGIFRRKFSEDEVRMNQYMDAIERRIYLPELSTLERDMADLEGIHEKFKPIEYELNDLYSTLFRYGVDILESARSGSRATMNPFVFTEPYEKEAFFVDEEIIEQAAHSLSRSILEGLPSFFQIVVGQAGMGKTHAAKYIYAPIMEKHRIKPLYIDCPINYDLVSGIFQELTQESLFPSRLAGTVRELRKNVPSTTRELLRVMEEITNLWKNQGYKGVLLILDEIENTVPYIFFATETHGFQPPLALRQVREITDQNVTENLGFLFCCRSKIYPLLQEALKIRNIQEFTLEPQTLKPEHFEKLITHRYLMWTITNGPKFENDVLQEIVLGTQGNTRDVIKYCRELFKFAAKNNLKVIDKLTLKKIGSIPLFRY